MACRVWGGGLQGGLRQWALAHSQRQKRSSTHWWGAEEVSVDEKYGWARAALAEIRWLGSYCRSCCRERRREAGPGCGQGPIAPKQLPSNPERPKPLPPSWRTSSRHSRIWGQRLCSSPAPVESLPCLLHATEAESVSLLVLSFPGSSPLLVETDLSIRKRGQARPGSMLETGAETKSPKPS